MNDDDWKPPAAWRRPAHRDFARQVRASLGRIVSPHAEEWERQGKISRAGWSALGEAGLLSLGHSGPEFLHSAIFLEELGRTGYAGIRAAVGVHAYMALSYLRMFGTAEQREEHLVPAGEGRLVLALAISETGAGSDLRHIGTRAVETTGGYLVSGEKTSVANGSQAGLIVTLARTRDLPPTGGLTGASLLLVDAGSQGVDRTPQPMLGWHSADVCRVGMDEVFVRADGVLGTRDHALLYLGKALVFERLVAGLLAVGGVAHCLDLLMAFVREHRVRDLPLSANQAVRHRIADHISEFEVVRHFAHHAAWLHSTGKLDPRTSAVLKERATELAVAAAQTCVQYHGARGYLDGSAPARLYRDAMAGTVAAGANELMRDIVFDETR